MISNEKYELINTVINFLNLIANVILLVFGYYAIKISKISLTEHKTISSTNTELLSMKKDKKKANYL